jgi:hypothetical protein
MSTVRRGRVNGEGKGRMNMVDGLYILCMKIEQ